SNSLLPELATTCTPVTSIAPPGPDNETSAGVKDAGSMASSNVTRRLLTLKDPFGVIATTRGPVTSDWLAPTAFAAFSRPPVSTLPDRDESLSTDPSTCWMIWLALQSGCSLCSRATTPVTYGVAIEVPLIVMYLSPG